MLPRTGLTVAVLLLLLVVFGTMPYSFTVPCTVIPASPCTVACPREGILGEIFVRPGDRVRRGDLLATLQTEDERLQEATLLSDLRRLSAKVDQARAEGKPGEAKILTAQSESTEAQLDLVRLRIERSEIRASEAGLVLAGDLRRALGSRFSVGDPLFQMAHGAKVQVELRIPERQVWQAREYRVATFVPTARPTEMIDLDGMTVHPSSVTVDGKNVFVARSTSFHAPSHLTPGMEGFVHVEVGHRSVWWVLTHRVSDWMR